MSNFLTKHFICYIMYIDKLSDTPELTNKKSVRQYDINGGKKCLNTTFTKTGNYHG